MTTQTNALSLAIPQGNLEQYIHYVKQIPVLSAEEEKALNSKMESYWEESAKADRKTTLDSFLRDTWKGIKKAHPEDFLSSPDTKISKKDLFDITEKITHLPENKKFFRKSIRLQNQRHKMVFEEETLDWAMGELMAYGSLVKEGISTPTHQIPSIDS